MKTRKVLTVNHVFDILASASTGADWKDAFLAAIPSRKGAVVKGEEEEEEEETLVEEEEENVRPEAERLGDEEERKAGEADDEAETEKAEKDVD